MSSPSTRRHFLAACAASSLVGLAGCTALGTDTSEPDPASDSYRIGGIHLVNADRRPHTLDLVVVLDDSIVHWNTYDLPARATIDGRDTVGSETVPPSVVGCIPGSYRIAVRLGTGLHQLFDGVPDQAHDGMGRDITIEEGAKSFRYEAVIIGDGTTCSTPTETAD